MACPLGHKSAPTSDAASSASQPTANFREMEASIHTDFKDDMSYGDYLSLEQILSAQHPLSDQHDEMLFIVIHQASELWLKLAGHELTCAVGNLQRGEFGHAFKVISRVKQILNQLTQSWNILATLTPVDYLKFRDALGHSSGFQSYGYRKIEFLLGNKNAQLLEVHKSNDVIYQELKLVLEAPSLYDVCIATLKQKGFAIDDMQLNRDVTQPYQTNASVLEAWKGVYLNADEHFELYELAEKLVDIEDSFQQWRFKHMYTVQRIIGNKAGTGGSSGVEFLKKSLDISFFPELFELRTQL
ncbi:tryptophan 2,3-dioxygenase [Shewanella sp. WXL01]|uniref:tryptophan 2,3-dioxygenase n=1 Tax=Shewanella sp. WXL01 TaxID=2709721 RepID=UPI00143841C4|nr:tryptophan 2,3-dioxygenase [Shewanella sp. WXL01]NKF51309.1 tryptophan 2,3-dioxygenase [Shewanella sp. WXL01]